MLRPWTAVLLVLALAVSAGCGTDGQHGAKTSVAATCTDSGFVATASPRLVALDKAVIRVDAGHGDVKALGAAAPGLVSAARLLIGTAQTRRPCQPRLVRADRLVLRATRELQRAGRLLGQLAAAAQNGKDFSSFQSQFLSSYYTGTDDFQVALAALRRAGLPPW